MTYHYSSMSKFKTKKKHQKNNIAKATKDIISKLAINLEENNEQIHHVAPKIGRKERRRKMKLERKLKRSKASTKTNDNKMFNKFGSRKRKNFTNADHGQCKKQKHDVPSVKLHKESTSIKENTSTGLTMDKIDQKERRKIKKQQKETLKKNEKLLKQNTEEDKTISKLEKLMYINTKKKKKNKLPSSFALDGLDYLLDVVNHTSNLSESDMSGKEDEG
ncbi:unnamed protein product [Clavelina lepadiformis]|uniref:Uncharacterized protein n=1 Tax=Clavelina lepadiformis TaxID=159417 RepID=A0ABP0FW44_CLALP